MAGQTRPVWDFEDIGDWWTRADADGIAPVVAVPTTAGTGSEVGRAAVVTDEPTHTKKIIFHPQDDAEGRDLRSRAHRRHAAGDHRRHRHGCARPLPRGLLRAGLSPDGRGHRGRGHAPRLANLPQAVEDGTDIEARANMMAAAAMGAIAFQKGLGAVHSLSHPVGALYNTHHGMTNAVFMPYVLAFNRPAIEEKIARLAASLGIAGGFDGFQTTLLELRKRIGVPHTLKELGVDDARFDEMAVMAVDDPSTGGNPVPFDAAAGKRLFRAAWEGDLAGVSGSPERGGAHVEDPARSAVHLRVIFARAGIELREGARPVEDSGVPRFARERAVDGRARRPRERGHKRRDWRSDRRLADERPD